MFVSGLTLQERPGAKKRYEKGTNRDAYARYLRRTSILIPFPPQLYERMPIRVKHSLFLELLMYVFDPVKHADQNKARGAIAEEGQAGPNGERPSDEPVLRI